MLFVPPLLALLGLMALGGATAGLGWRATGGIAIALWVFGVGVATADNTVLPSSILEIVVQALFWYSIQSAVLFLGPFSIGRALAAVYLRAERGRT